MVEIMQRNIATLLVDQFESYGIEYVFFVPGASIDTILTALIGRKPKLIMCRHEASAGHAAAAYAKKTGKPAVVMATAGPGATNLVTAAATATLEHTPLIAITGQMDSKITFKPSHQVIDAEMLFVPVTRFSKEITSPDTLTGIWDLAYQKATTGERGAVHLALAADLLAQETKLVASKPLVNISKPQAQLTDIAVAQQMLIKATCPVLILGADAVHIKVADAVEKLMSATHIATICTFEGGGIIRPQHRQSYMGRLGIFQNQPCNQLLDKADLIICAGYNIAELDPSKWNKTNKTIIHIAEFLPIIDNGYMPHLQLLGDIACNIDELAKNIKYIPTDEYTQLKQTIRTQLENRLTDYQIKDDLVHPLHIIRCLQETITPEDTLISDVGSHQYWIAEHFTSNTPRQFINSMGFQTMGVSLPFAIGVALSQQSGKVYSISGDGSFLMCMMELATAVEHKLPIIHLIWTDNTYNLVAIQEMHRYQQTHGIQLIQSIDFVKIAESFGAKGIKVKHPDELSNAIKLAQATEGPVIIDIDIDYSDNLKKLIQ